MEDYIWSGTDFPYMCLIDVSRTNTFKKAIEETVKPGDVVVDVGSGTGILAFFAASAGAAKVYAVEVDHLMAESLRTSVKLNNLEDKVEVIEANALQAELPQNVNVVIAELIETGLLDEMQVQVINSLHERGIIGPATKVIPSAYETFVRLLEVKNDFYGYKIAAPIHDWPFYSMDAREWHQLDKAYVTGPQSLGRFDFEAGLVDPKVEKSLQFEVPQAARVNALEISGLSQLSLQTSLGAAHSYNGNKILYFGEISGPAKPVIEFSYHMSQGLGRFNFSVQA
jgi:protein-L-isoaspartate O-methyltransferase